MNDEDYWKLQNVLLEHPRVGNIIIGSGGIRKIRWGGKGRGKRGGTRLLYYWATDKDQIYMLFIFAKNECDDITKDQLSILKKAVEMEFHNEK